MARKPNIRWRKRDLETLDKTVRNFNAKLSRLQKKNPENKYLPEKLTKKGIKEMILTRDDFNYLIDRYKSFSVRGNEDIINVDGKGMMTKWAFKQGKKAEARDIEVKKKELKKILEDDLYSAGKPLGIKRKDLYAGQGGKGRVAMHSIPEVALESVEKDPLKMSPKEFMIWSNSMERRMLDSSDFKKKVLFKENYIAGMITEGYSQEMIDFVRTISPDIMVEALRIDDDMTITFVYSQIELEERQKRILLGWSRHLGRSSITKTEYIDNLRNTNLSDNILESVIKEGNFSNEVWTDILTKSGYSPERIRNLFR